MTRSSLYRAFALAFCAAALFHAAALVWPQIAEPAPPARHAIFVILNAVLAAGLWKRPRGFPIVFALFTAQQLVSHGRGGYAVWRDEGRLDWASLVTVAFLPAVLALLVRDARARAAHPSRTSARW